MQGCYPSDLTDEQWALVEPFIPVFPGGRPRATSMRDVLNAVFYLLKTGCQWRYLPKDFPPKSTVWGYFNEWRHNGTLEDIHEALRQQVRQQAGRAATPSAGSIDSQSVSDDRSLSIVSCRRIAASNSAGDVGGRCARSSCV